MWSHCYRKHAIMPFPSFDTATNSWAPQADISWPTGPERNSEFVRFPIRVMTEREAVACALRKSKSWIDRRLKQTHNTAAERSLAIENIVTLREHLRQTGPKPALRIPAWEAKQPTDRFTFSQFNSEMSKWGTASTNKLRKSYNALMSLHTDGNCSVEEIRSKVKRYGEILNRSRAGRQHRAVCLPLTPRDWQRIN